MHDALVEIIKKHTAEPIEQNSDIQMDLGIDSFQSLCLITEIKDAFKISLSPDDTFNVTTVGDLDKLILSKGK